MKYIVQKYLEKFDKQYTKYTGRKMNRHIIAFITLAISAISLFSCKSVDPCPEEAAQGNAGGLFNTLNEEYSPSFLNDTLYYTSLEAGKKTGEKIFISKYQDESFTAPVLDTALPIYKYKNGGLPSFFEDKLTGKTEVYFAAMSEETEKINRNIYYSEKIDNVWTQPILIKEINTDDYESHPSISPDGRILAFTSDRDGSVGDIDIYLSFRDGNGKWSEPINAGTNINTESTELSPHLSSDGSLYYASKGFTGEGGFDIVVSKRSDNGERETPYILPFPINTEWDETGPYIWKDMLYLASNRRGGCGGKDLYAFTLCGPVFLEIEIAADNPDLPLSGTLILFDENRREIAKYDIDDSGFLRVPLEASKRYNIQYFNSCVPQYVPEQRIQTPCDDRSTVKLVANFIIPDEMEQFDFEKYEVPFFVSGYYMPITDENLNDLRNKFQFNLIGNTPETRYIENPAETYDQYSPVVEMALRQAADFIFNIISNLKSTCLENNNKKIIIRVTGYADPRIISDVAKYQDEDINDDELEVFVERGTTMDNMLLSQLRAYFTAIQFTKYLKNYDNYDELKERIKWEIVGMGIDKDEDRENILKRRVNIEIGVSE